MEIEIIIAVIILIALVFLATVDMAFSHLSDVSLRRISTDEEVAEKRRAAEFLREIVENRPRFRFALSSAIQVLLVCFTVLLTVIISTHVDGKVRVLSFSLLSGLAVTVLLRQVVPRLLIQHDTERKLLFLLPAIRPIYAITSFFAEPITSGRRMRGSEKLDTTVAPDASEEKDDERDDDFQALMEVGEAEGIIEEEERELIETMVEFGDTLAGEIMTPRTEIVAVPVEATIKDARDIIIEEKYSRLPVYRETIDNIEGMVYVRDLLAALATGRKENSVDTIMRDAFFVPETKTAAELLKSMQANHVQVAVVIDEYGGVAGLITVEDILEEIVGEIEDEDIDREEIVDLKKDDAGSCDVPGSTEIDEIEELFGLDLEDEDYTTVAGLVVTEAGYVPKVGEKLTVKGLSVEVLEGDEKRITLLRLARALEADAEVDEV